MRVAMLILALLAGCATPIERTAAPAALPLIDLTDEFAAYADSTQGQSDAERVAGLAPAFAGLIPEFYDRARAAERYDERVRTALDEFPAKRAGIEAVSRRFAALIVPARTSFEAAFGPVPLDRPVYLLHSMGEMDGGTRTLAGHSRLVFGADVIARVHKDQDMTPFFHHELFHVYHERLFPECDPVWCNLWTEGLATYVSHALNPHASDAQLLLTIPVPLRAAVESNRPRAICSVVARLGSTKAEDYRALFNFRSADPALPGRMGYYVGYLVAREAAKDHSLQVLARMQPAEVKPLVERTLARLATCPKEDA